VTTKTAAAVAALAAVAVTLASMTADAQQRSNQRSTAAAKAAPQTKTFTTNAALNDRLHKKMGIPVFFTVPPSARAPLKPAVDTGDTLLDYKHPNGRSGDLGLRLFITKRAGMAQRLARSGLIETGDLLLTFRPEWGGGGPYPNIQMGISHTGIAYPKDGQVRNIDNPLDEEYHGPNFVSNLVGGHYGTLNYIHIIRPRNLDDAQRANLLAWIDRFKTNARRIYPKQIEFNSDYNAPKYEDGKPPAFIRHVGRTALGQPVEGPPLSMYCSEFVWSVMALRQCDPAKTASDFSGTSMPSCINTVMTPMSAIGSIVTRQSRNSYAGLVDGPLMVIDALKAPRRDRLALVDQIFTENPASVRKMSEGHREIAKQLSPTIAPLKRYYENATGNAVQRVAVGTFTATATRNIPDNYSPTSFLINTLMPADNTHRTMDYVMTVVIE
jgi:hypothetical protein